MGVVDTQHADREQVEADWWFGRLHGQLLREIDWAFCPDWPIPYELTAVARVEIDEGGFTFMSLDDFLDFDGH